jgi:hypothetical protein
MNSVVELVAAVVLAAAAIIFVLQPILSPRQGAPVVDETGADPDDDLSTRVVALRALKEIEFDRATGKLDDADYDALKLRYTAEALEALRAGDAPPPLAASPSAPAASRSCPTHGPRTEPGDAAYCSECGRRLEGGRGFCSRCGAAMEPEARFCSSCGQRVAA